MMYFEILFFIQIMVIIGESYILSFRRDLGPCRRSVRKSNTTRV
jgi:hypothetical protein